MEKIKQLFKQERTYKILFVIFMFILCFIFSQNVRLRNAPDERMKEQVCKYIYDNGTLPKGDEEEILDPTWGTSYAFTPYIPYIIGGYLMRFFGNFINNYDTLFYIARFVNVLTFTGCIIFIIKIADLLFDKHKPYKWFFITLISLLPQFVYLGSYLNTDIFALLTISIIIYNWIKGMKTGWCWKNVIGLAIGIGLCALSYYNSYGYILMSVPLFIISYILTKKKEAVKEKKEDYKKQIVLGLLKKGLAIIGIVFAVAGWWFIRNYIIHDGDFLGMKSSDQCAEIHAEEEFKPSKHPTSQKNGESIQHMMVFGHWLRETFKTFICVFSYWKIPLSRLYYFIFFFIYAIGFIGTILYFIKNIKTKYYKENFNKLILEITFLICMGINMFLSVYYSWTTDFQPQGRYLMPSLIPLTYFAITGFKEVMERIFNTKKLKKKNKDKKLEYKVVYITTGVTSVLLLAYIIYAITVQIWI